MKNKLVLSALPHTWIFDVDGTICVHNGYKQGKDILLQGIKELFQKIPPEDMIILLTSRQKDTQKQLEDFMIKNGLRYNYIIFDAPMGERILINDDKPSVLKMAYAVNKKRNDALTLNLKIDEKL